MDSAAPSPGLAVPALPGGWGGASLPRLGRLSSGSTPDMDSYLGAG